MQLAATPAAAGQAAATIHHDPFSRTDLTPGKTTLFLVFRRNSHAATYDSCHKRIRTSDETHST
jgi:hypothetical protein